MVVFQFEVMNDDQAYLETDDDHSESDHDDYVLFLDLDFIA